MHERAANESTWTQGVMPDRVGCGVDTAEYYRCGGVDVGDVA